jgi:hypothetical protein
MDLTTWVVHRLTFKGSIRKKVCVCLINRWRTISEVANIYKTSFEPRMTMSDVK